MKLFKIFFVLLIYAMVFYCTKDPNAVLDIDKKDPWMHQPQMVEPEFSDTFNFVVADTGNIKLTARHPAVFENKMMQFQIQYSKDGSKVWEDVISGNKNKDSSYSAILKVYWPAKTNDTTITLWVRAVDEHKTFSDSIKINLFVHQYRPVITAVTNDSTPVKRTITLACSAHDTLKTGILGKPTQYIWTVSSIKPIFGVDHSKMSDTTSDSTSQAFFSDSGLYSITVVALDKDSLKSSTKTFSVKANAYPPKLNYHIPDIYSSSGDSLEIRIPSLDNVTSPGNVKIMSYKIQFSWDAQILDTSIYSKPILNHRDQLVLPVKWENKSIFTVASFEPKTWYCISAMDADSLWSNADTVFFNNRVLRPFLRDTLRLVPLSKTFISDSIQFRITASDSSSKRVTKIHWRWKSYNKQTGSWSEYDADSSTNMILDKSLNQIKVDTSYSPKIKLGKDSIPYIVKVWAENSAGRISDTFSITTIPQLGKPKVVIEPSIYFEINTVDTIHLLDVFDPDTEEVGKPKYFYWKYAEKTNVEPIHDSIFIATFSDTIPRTLIVWCKDGKGIESDPDTVKITISRGVPTATFLSGTASGSIATVAFGDSVTIYFGGTDPTGQPLSYEWVVYNGEKITGNLASAAVLPNQVQSTSRKFWPGNVPGTYFWTYKVIDQDGNIVPKTFTISVDNPPLIWNDPNRGVWNLGKWQ